MGHNTNLKSLSHHAYLLVGDSGLRLDIISILEKVHGIVARGNPDFFDQIYSNFTIDDARELKSLHSTRPIGIDRKKIFIITTDGMTSESQNALLKLFEEPAEYAHFFLIVPSTHILIPTIKSRIREISINSYGECGSSSADVSQTSDGAREFLKMSYSRRLETVKKLIDDISKEKRSKQDAINFVAAVQVALYKNGGVCKSALRALESTEMARAYIYDRAPSMKMLLEYVALNI